MRKNVWAAIGLAVAISSSLSLAVERLLVPTTMKDLKACEVYAVSAAARLEATLKQKVTGSCDRYRESDGKDTVLFAFSFADRAPNWLVSTKASRTLRLVPVAVPVTKLKWMYDGNQFIQSTQTVTRIVNQQQEVVFATLADCDNDIRRELDRSGPTFQGTSDCPNGECRAFAGYCIDAAGGGRIEYYVFRAHFYPGRRNVSREFARGERANRAPVQYEVATNRLNNSTICATNVAIATPRLEKFLGQKIDGTCVKFTVNGFDQFPFVFALSKPFPGLDWDEARVVPTLAVDRKKVVDVVEYAYAGDTAVIRKSEVTKTFAYTENVPIKYADQIACDKDAHKYLADGHADFAAGCDPKNCAAIAAHCDYVPETANYSYFVTQARKP